MIISFDVLKPFEHENIEQFQFRSACSVRYVGRKCSKLKRNVEIAQMLVTKSMQCALISRFGHHESTAHTHPPAPVSQSATLMLHKLGISMNLATPRIASHRHPSLNRTHAGKPNISTQLLEVWVAPVLAVQVWAVAVRVRALL